MSFGTVLVVEDDRALCEAIKDILLLSNFEVITADNGVKALDIASKKTLGIVISDVQMEPMDGNELLKKIKSIDSSLPVLMMTAYGSIKNAVGSILNGASDYIAKPFENETLIGLVKQHIRYEEENAVVLTSKNAQMNEVLSMAKRVAKTEATVMLVGESGTGKEVVSRFIHDSSLRNKKPFVAINCAAIPDNMLESTLFGYEKGAFTGAYQSSPGKFELAQGGTLLLDEVSEMDLSLQAKLLRVLQEREVERIGGKKTIPLNVRVIATSNRNMKQEIENGRFREDLYYRLNVFPLCIPPLRERSEDIENLVLNILSKRAGDCALPTPVLSQEAVYILSKYTWPGNVRELDNVLQRALILCTSGTINANDIHIDFEKTGENVDEVTSVDEQASGSILKNNEYSLIIDVLKNTGGNRKDASTKLGISQRTLRYKIARMRDMGMSIPG